MSNIQIYYWVTFLLSAYWLLKTPSKMRPADNFFGSLICAMFGFLLWPMFFIAFIKTRKAAP